MTDIEDLTRHFLAESNKYLDLSMNPDLVWVPSGISYEVRARVVSVISPEFTWFVRYNPKVPRKVHVGVFFEDNECVYRLDVNDGHQGRVGTHLHRPYTKDHGTTLVDFLDDVPEDVWPATNWFLERAKIVTLPDEYWSELPKVAPVRSLLSGR